MVNKKYPVLIDNVAYLNGDPPQDVLESVAKSMVGDEERLKQMREQFADILKANGRPCGPIETTFGMGLEDLLVTNSVMTPAPWRRLKQSDLVVISVHGREVEGWWVAVEEQVLLHMPFGKREPMTALELANAIAGRPDPAPELVDWVKSLSSQAERTAITQVYRNDDVPANLRGCVAPYFHKEPWLFGYDRQRKFTIWANTDDGLYEWGESFV